MSWEWAKFIYGIRTYTNLYEYIIFEFEKLKTIHLNTKWYLMSFSKKKKKVIFNVIIPKKKKITLQTKKAYS